MKSYKIKVATDWFIHYIGAIKRLCSVTGSNLDTGSNTQNTKLISTELGWWCVAASAWLQCGEVLGLVL